MVVQVGRRLPPALGLVVVVVANGHDEEHSGHDNSRGERHTRGDTFEGEREDQVAGDRSRDRVLELVDRRHEE